MFLLLSMEEAIRLRRGGKGPFPDGKCLNLLVSILQIEETPVTFYIDKLLFIRKNNQ